MKKLYNQPAVQVVNMIMESMILAGSGAASNGAGKVYTGIDTNDQW